MWQQNIASALFLASFCLAAPQQPKADDGSLDALISSVFNNNGQAGTGPVPVTTPKASSQQGNLDDLISQVFNDNNNSNNNPVANPNIKPNTDGTILGVNNQNNVGRQDCECVPYYQCQNGTILDDGIGLIDIRSGFGADRPQSPS